MEKKRPLTTVEKRSIEGQTAQELNQEKGPSLIQDALNKLKEPNLYELETDGETFARVKSKVDGSTIVFTENKKQIKQLTTPPKSKLKPQA